MGTIVKEVDAADVAARKTTPAAQTSAAKAKEPEPAPAHCCYEPKVTLTGEVGAQGGVDKVIDGMPMAQNNTTAAPACKQMASTDTEPCEASAEASLAALNTCEQMVNANNFKVGPASAMEVRRRGGDAEGANIAHTDMERAHDQRNQTMQRGTPPYRCPSIPWPAHAML